MPRVFKFGLVSLKPRFRLSAVVLVALGAAALLAGFGGQKLQWCIVAHSETQSTAVNPVSKIQTVLKDRHPSRHVSPDGRYAAAIVMGKADRPLGLYLEHLDDPSAQPQHLMPGREWPADLSWMHDSKSFVCSHGDGDTQVYLVELEAPADPSEKMHKIREKRLSDGKNRATQPVVSPRGAIAWLSMREQHGKMQYMDLMVIDRIGDEPRAIVQRQLIRSIGFSPDGTKLACSVEGELRIIDAATGKTISSRRYDAIDKRLYAHHARSISWSPDGELIAAPLRFSGGREYSGDGPHEPMFGDREVFIIPVDPEFPASWVTLPQDVVSAAWIEIESVPKAAS